MSSSTVTLDDDMRANAILDKDLALPQEFPRQKDDGSSSVAHFRILRSGNVDESFSGGMNDFEELEDRRAVVGDGRFAVRADDEFVHSARTEGGGDRAGDGEAGGDVGEELRRALGGIRSLCSRTHKIQSATSQRSTTKGAPLRTTTVGFPLPIGILPAILIRGRGSVQGKNDNSLSSSSRFRRGPSNLGWSTRTRMCACWRSSSQGESPSRFRSTTFSVKLPSTSPPSRRSTPPSPSGYALRRNSGDSTLTPKLSISSIPPFNVSRPFALHRGVSRLLLRLRRCTDRCDDTWQASQLVPTTTVEFPSSASSRLTTSPSPAPPPVQSSSNPVSPLVPPSQPRAHPSRSSQRHTFPFDSSRSSRA